MCENREGPGAPARARAWVRRARCAGGRAAASSRPLDGTGASHDADDGGGTQSPEVSPGSDTEGVGGSAPASPPEVLSATPVRQYARRSGADLAVHLLGPFCVAINDSPVDEWFSARARSLFAYLLTHRQPLPREVLMEAFWPDARPNASRNSLNVTLHGLRRLLRTATDAPVIVYSHGVYRIHPDVHLWLDVDAFEERASHGRRLEDAGEFDRAAEAYEAAAGLYRGEFLANDPYEEWAALTRERLRLTHLDTLDRLSNLHFAIGRYATCGSLCQRILEEDSCREDAHRRLMRCYARQGLPHLALLQYRVCARALAEELGVAPQPATYELNERIRRHEPV